MGLKIKLLSLSFFLLIGLVSILSLPRITQAQTCPANQCSGICHEAFTYSGAYCTATAFCDPSCTSGCQTSSPGCPAPTCIGTQGYYYTGAYCTQTPYTDYACGNPSCSAYSISGNVIDTSTGLNYTGGITVTAVDGSGNPYTVQNDSPTAGAYTVSNLPPNTYIVNYTSLPSGYALTYPTGSPPSFQVTVGPSCNTNGYASATCSSGSISNLNFNIAPNVKPWIQSVGGDFYQNGFTDQIPSTATTTVPYSGGGPFASVYGTGQTPGIIYSGNVDPNFGTSGGTASQPNWVAGGALYPEIYQTNGVPLSTSYARIDALVDQYGKRSDTTAVMNLALAPGCTNTNPIVCNLSSVPSGIYYAYNPLTLTGTSQIQNGTNLIILVGERMENGSPLGINTPTDPNTTVTPEDLTVDGKVLVADGSTLLITVAGNINIDPTVGEASPSTYCTAPQVTNTFSTGCDLEGYYSSDQNFNLNGTNNCSVGSDLRFNLGGSVVSNAKDTTGGFNFNRDLCANDANYPVFSITERPDFILNSPDFFKTQSRIWQEVTP